MRTFVLLVALVSSTWAYALDPQLTIAGERVRTILEAYQAAGYEFTYSSNVVTDQLRFTQEPDAIQPIARLRQGLESLGLLLRPRGDGVWLILPGQTRVQQVRGRVVNKDTREPIAGVRVELAGVVAVTDDKGYFTLDRSASGLLSVEHAAYQPETVASTTEELLEIPISPLPRIDEVVVVSSRHTLRANAGSPTHRFDSTDLDALPDLGDDSIRVSNYLPGMASIGVSAKPHIRGGSQDELLVMFNNIELIEPFHLRDFQSIFSGLNPSLIRSIDVYTGGFPARYGDRMSGVMDIETRDVPMEFGGELALSLLNTSANLHDSFTDDRGEWLVSLRRGNLDLVTKQINSRVGRPSYEDGFGQVKFELSADTEIELGSIVYRDDIELKDFDTDGEIANSRYDNRYLWVQLHHRWQSGLDSSLALSRGAIRHHRYGSLTDEDLDNGDAQVDDRRRFDLTTLSLTTTWTPTDRVQMEGGLRYNWLDGHYDYQVNIRRGELATIIGLPRVIDRSLFFKPKGNSGAVYGSIRMQPWDRLVYEVGLRWDFQDYGNLQDSQFSPRVNARWDVSDQTQLRLALGRYYQSEAIHELQIADGLDRYELPQRADHLILGLVHKFKNERYSVRVEAFNKQISAPKVRFENLFNPLVLLPELAADRVSVIANRARARGLEITTRYGAGEHLNAWLAVSYTKAEDRIGSRWRPRSWDQGVTATLGVVWRRGPWAASVVTAWHEGWRTTAVPTEVATDEPTPLAENSTRLPRYLSLDAKVSYTWRWPHQSLTAFAEVTNAFNRANVGGIEYDVSLEDDEFEIEGTDETLLPLVPSIGIRWQF